MQVVLSSRNIFMEIIGRGGGILRMIMPTDIAPARRPSSFAELLSPMCRRCCGNRDFRPAGFFYKSFTYESSNVGEQKFVQVASDSFIPVLQEKGV